MNTTEGYTVTMSDNLLVRGNDEKLDRAILDLQELIPTKPITQHSHIHGEGYP